MSNLDLVSFENLLPPFASIVKDFGIDPAVAFYIWRPILTEKIRRREVDRTIELQKKKLLRDLASSDKSTEPQGDSFSLSLPEAHIEMQEMPTIVATDAGDSLEHPIQKTIVTNVEE